MADRGKAAVRTLRECASNSVWVPCGVVVVQADEVEAALTARDARIAELEAEVAGAEVLRRESYLAGVKDGWNLGVVGNKEGFAAIFDEHRRTLTTGGETDES